MKFKKILLFILIFLFFLIIQTNVNAYVLTEGGVEKYYLQDLPFDDSGDSHTSVFFHNTNNSTVVCIVVPNYCVLGGVRSTSSSSSNSFSFYLFDKSDNSKVAITTYLCTLTEDDDVYIGGEWSSTIYDSNYTVDSYAYLTNIGGTGKVYPANSKSVVRSLPEDSLGWGDDFLIYYDPYSSSKIYCAVPQAFDKDYIFAEKTSSSPYLYYCSKDLSSTINFKIYEYDYNNDTWSLYKSNSSYVYGVVFYSVKNCYNSSLSVELPTKENIFKNLYLYKVYPYIMNSQDDLAKGEADIIIMPRRF